MIGISANHSVWQWSGTPSSDGMVATSEPVIDFVSATTSPAAANGSCTCMITQRTGSLSCTCGSLLSPALAQLSVIDTATAGPLNRSNQLTLFGGIFESTICIMIQGMVTCSGPVRERFRWGGYAMQPRQSLSRFVHIATDGVDAPFCGLHYFKACATIQYAMTLLESAGPWIEFVYAPGTYIINKAITIDWTGITIRGSSSANDVGTNDDGATIWQLSKRFTINAPSFRLINIAIETAMVGFQDTILFINSGNVTIMCAAYNG
jgi:hypothetical protein